LAWSQAVNEIQVHELACHHEAVMDSIPAAQIGRKLQQRLSARQGRTREAPPAPIPQKTNTITAA
jgi:hypothetical protein